MKGFNPKIEIVLKLQHLMVLLFLFITSGLWSCNVGDKANNKAKSPDNVSAEDSIIFHYQLQLFTNSQEDQLAALGQKIVNETYKYFYKNGVKVGNQLSCSNCHLNGGTKPYSIPFIGLKNVFPTYLGRANKVATIEERINGCFERSINGDSIPTDSKEMKAIVAYINFLSRGINNKGRLKGQGLLSFNPPDRMADTLKGKSIYQNRCQTCHQTNGAGIKLPNNIGYTFPPLWGPDSFNDGAGMGRILTAARFIKGNMPLGTTYKAPQLTDEEVYDVAGYINSFPRPIKSGKEKDYPNLTKKPKDCPYPPYADNIPQIQHKYGPFNFKN